MSISQSVNQSTGNQLFDRHADDIGKLIFQFLKPEKGSLSVDNADDRTIVATSSVCKNWQTNSTLKKERKEASARLRQRANLQNVHQEMRLLNECPPAMVRAFRNSRTPIFQLPVLDLGDQMGGTGYIDFIQTADMPQSVMRFRDRYGRPGIALKIHASRRIALQARLDRVREMASYVRDDLRQGDLSSLHSLARITVRTIGRFFREGGHDAVLASFKRYTNPESPTWSFGWGNSDGTMENLYNARHYNNNHIGPDCPHCPFVGSTINPRVFSDLLNGVDPDFSLPGHTIARSRNQPMARGTRVSQRTIVITALAALMIAYFANYCLSRVRSL